MKKSLTAIQLKYKYFNRLKALALAAILCTVALAVLILVESWLPGEKSSKQSDAVSNTILSVAGKPNGGDYSTILGIFGINVTSSASYKLFMRKLIGHYLMFAILGVGLGASCYLTSKNRYLYAMYALAFGVVIAITSEILQLPVFTTGRVFTWEDIGIDTLGVLTGIILASLVILIVTTAMKFACKEKYPLFKQTLTAISSRPIFNRVGKITVTYDDCYLRI